MTLTNCQRLYNTALEHRKEWYRISGKGISYNKQQNELPKLKEQFPEYHNIHSQVLQNVLARVDFAFKNFFRRVKIKKEKAGFPRYKSKDRYDSFCYPQKGFYIKGSRIELSKIGLIKAKFHRIVPTNTNIKNCIVKKECEKWYIILILDIENATIQKKEVYNTIGIDLGLKDFAVLSNGTEIKNPKYLKRSEDKLKEIQIRFSKGNGKTIKKRLGRLHRKVANQRKDFQHKLSTNIVRSFDLIAYEDLKINKMIEDNKYNLQKSIHDASWGTFISMIRYKAESAGTYAIAVNPKGTTQKCSNCGSLVPKTLYVRSHKCTTCGFETTRDHNAAINIHKLGISLVGNHNSLCLFSEAHSPSGVG